jgi:hypothetical protein
MRARHSKGPETLLEINWLDERVNAIQHPLSAIPERFAGHLDRQTQREPVTLPLNPAEAARGLGSSA